MLRSRVSVVVACAVILACAGCIRAHGRPLSAAQNEDLTSLLATLRKNVGLTGNIAVALKTQDAIAALGKRDPKAVVPALVAQLRSLRAGERKTTLDFQMALFSVLESIGPAAEGAVPVLTEIVQDDSERNDFVLLKARMALSAIGTPAAKSAGGAADQRSVNQWLRKASPADIAQAAAHHAYLIRRELRSTRMSEEVIEASVSALRPIGPQAKDAVPSLVRAWADPRIGTNLRSLIASCLTAAGVKDVGSAATALRAGNRTDTLAEIIADARSDNSLVSTMAMSELGDRGPSEKSIDALISALEENRNPGQAALVLGKFGTAAARAIPSLLARLDDRNAGANVIQALGLIGSGDERTVSALRRVVADDRSPHRSMAAAALGSLHAADALPELRHALSAPDKYTRILAANALGGLGVGAAAAAPELSTLLEDPDTDVRVSAVQSLGMIGPAAAPAVSRIGRELQSSDRRLKTAAVTALERIGGQEASAALEADARRYAEADRSEFLLLRQTGDRSRLLSLMEELPQARRIQLARNLLNDQDAAVASLAAGTLIREGREEETVPALANLLLSMPAGNLSGGIGAVLQESGDSLLLNRLMARICAYFEANMSRYSPSDQERIRKQICPDRKLPESNRIDHGGSISAPGMR